MRELKVIISGWSTVIPKRRDEVVESFKDLVLRARSAPGCLDFAMTADPVDPSRVNIFELWQSEKHLKSWRAVCKRPKHIAKPIRVDVQKHILQKSGPPF
ncbi:MAG TPA: antibiotic biosynthesis monooxygenase family protein [Polyangiaceae bacterium]|nr:antibiotic biosynthesis monooxygenase family protein [Polyangiaceae bacterium]